MIFSAVLHTLGIVGAKLVAHAAIDEFDQAVSHQLAMRDEVPPDVIIVE
jgi:hypothetical protein